MATKSRRNMKRVIGLLVFIVFAEFAASSTICLADEKSEAETVIGDAEALIEELNSMNIWMEPALTVKKEAEKYLSMAKEAFEAQNYTEARQYAQTALDYAEKAKGLRALYLYSLLQRSEEEGMTVKINTVTVVNPPNGSIVSGTVTITVEITGCINTVEFYIDSILSHTDTTSPFTYNWDTTGYVDGSTHTISVKGYCGGAFEDDDTVTVVVWNAPICMGTILLLLFLTLTLIGKVLRK